ncbi:MAG: hypothetical protein WCO19_05090 [Candidatus Saccharibacteria bacterium]
MPEKLFTFVVPNSGAQEFESVVHDVSKGMSHHSKLPIFRKSNRSFVETKLNEYHFIAEKIDVIEGSTAISGLASVIQAHKGPWEEELETTLGVHMRYPIPRVIFGLDESVQPPVVTCHVTL